jgi:hypothetical protein
MSRRYTTEDRIMGGSMEPRLNPEFNGTGLNQKLGPHWHQIHNTEGKSMSVPDPEHRRRQAGLPDRFKGK